MAIFYCEKEHAGEKAGSVVAVAVHLSSIIVTRCSTAPLDGSSTLGHTSHGTHEEGQASPVPPPPRFRQAAPCVAQDFAVVLALSSFGSLGTSTASSYFFSCFFFLFHFLFAYLCMFIIYLFFVHFVHFLLLLA